MRMFNDILDLYCACLQGARSILRAVGSSVLTWLCNMFVIIFSLAQSLWLEEGPVSSAALCGETWKRDAFCTLLPAPSLSASVSTTVQEYIVSPCSDIRRMADCINLISYSNSLVFVK